MRLAKRIVSSLIGGAAFFAATTPVLAQYYYDYNPYDTTAASAGVLGIGLVWCCVLLVVLVIDIVFAFIVYKDAQKNKVENPVIWAAVAFFLNIIGLLIYFVAIKPDAVKKIQGTSTKVEEKPVTEEKK